MAIDGQARAGSAFATAPAEKPRLGSGGRVTDRTPALGDWTQRQKALAQGPASASGCDTRQGPSWYTHSREQARAGSLPGLPALTCAFGVDLLASYSNPCAQIAEVRARLDSLTQVESDQDHDGGTA